MTAYCRPHSSHFCPCCKPHLYDPNDPKDREKIRGWEEIAPIVPIEQPAQEEPPPDDRWYHRLTPAQDREAVAEGERHRAIAERTGARHAIFDPGPAKALENTIRAARGELATSLMLGLAWTGRELYAPDVGGFYEVRSVEIEWKGLTYGLNDAPRREAPFILTLVREPEVWAKGWEWGTRIEVPRYERTGNRYHRLTWWLVPPAQLQPMDDLPPVGASYEDAAAGHLPQYPRPAAAPT